MASLIAFLKGPMVWIALAVFFGGIVVHAILFFALSRHKDPNYLPGVPKAKPKKKKEKEAPKESKTLVELINQPLQPLVRIFDKQWGYVESSIFLTHPVVATVTLIFHLLLFIIPIFLLAHNELIRNAVGFSFPSLSEGLADSLTMVVLFCGAFFLWRRGFVRRVRAISTAWDYCVLLLTLTPFVSGFMAFHQLGDYATVMLIHIASAELVLILIPFTKLNHMIYFFLYRLLIGSEYSFGQGKRAW